MEESIIIEAFKASLQLYNESSQNVQTLISAIQTSIEGLIPKLMSIVLSENPIEIRQLAATYIKNITKVWKDSKREFPIPQADKAVLRANIIKFLEFSINEQIRSQFKKIVCKIAKTDFPWEGLQQQIDDALESDNSQIYAALTMIYQISKAYKYQMKENRQNFDEFINRFYEKLDKLLGAFLIEGNEDNYCYITLILKIFWSSFRMRFMERFSAIPQLDLLLEKLQKILKINLGSLETLVENEEEARSRDIHPSWVIKYWALQILYEFFISCCYYGQNTIVMASAHFQNYWANPLLSTVLVLLYKKPTCYIPERVTKYLLQCVSRGKLRSTEIIRDVQFLSNEKLNIPDLISNIIIPILYRTRSEEQAWQEKPIEFLINEKNFVKECLSAKTSAIDLLISICNYNYLQSFLDYASIELLSNPQILHKEAILHALGSISQILQKNPVLSKHIQNLLSWYVLPEFGSQIGFLRARACWVYAQFSSFLPADQDNQLLVFQKICEMLLDSDLPVRFEAAIAFSKILGWEIVTEKLSSCISNIVEVYLILMNQINNPDLVNALQSVVEKNQFGITPFATTLIQHLHYYFLNLEKNIEAEGKDESPIIGASILKTIDKLASYLGDKPQDLLNISHLLIPAFDYCFSEPGCYGFICDAAILLGRLLYLTPNNFLPHLFPFIRILRNALVGEGNAQPYALDCSIELFYPIANFISKYPLLTAQNLDIFISIGFGLLKEDYTEDQDFLIGCKIFIALLENLKGSLDQYIPDIIRRVSSLYNCLGVNKSIKVEGSVVICISLWNNLIVTIQSLQNLNFVKNAWNFCFENTEQYKGSLAKKYAILGLSSSLCEYLPSFFNKNISALYQKILKLWKNVDEDTTMDDKLEDKGTKMEEDFEEEEDEEDDDADDIVLDNLYDSPIKGLELKEYLKNTFLNFSIKNPDDHSKACEGLNEEEISALNEIIS